MKAYKVEVLVLDFEDYGQEQIELMLGDVRGLSSSIQSIQKADIGQWADEHPLNHRSNAKVEYQRLFGAGQPEAAQGDVVLTDKQCAKIKSQAAKATDDWLESQPEENTQLKSDGVFIRHIAAAITAAMAKEKA